MTQTDKRDLKIAYLCDQSPEDKWSYSSGNARMFGLLKDRFGDVTALGTGWHMVEPIRRLIKSMSEPMEMRLRWRAHILLSRLIARGLARELQAQQYDVLFGTYSFHSLLNLKPPYPLLTVYTSDATPTAYKQSEIGAQYGSYFSPSRLFDNRVLQAERKVFQATDLLLWPSAWLKDRADALYGLNDSKSIVVPWGANITPPARDGLKPENPMDGQIRLALIGRNWVGKGGPVAVAVLDTLRERGVDAHLTVVGCVPPDEDMRQHMTVHRLLDKSVPEELATYEQILTSAHFVVMPSYESYGFVFCEASAYGLPSLCLNIGGVPIRDGINGHGFAPGTPATDYVDKILEYRDNPQAYARLRVTSRDYYESHLNWATWTDSCEALIRERLAQRT